MAPSSRAPIDDAQHRLGALLARWHLWRKGFSTERGYARLGGPADHEDELEQLLMLAVEQEVAALALPQQRAVGQRAKAECLGLDQGEGDEVEQALALGLLKRRLIATGVL
jgi:hypothetical protein